MTNLVLYAPPAAGKGTLCEFLKKNYNCEIISIGQVLRNARSMDTEVGRIIIETQDKGVLTPDNIVAEALKNELQKIKNKMIVVEGYPRNLDQAKLLDTILDNYIVINLDIKREDAMKRTLGRLTCGGCGKIYSVYNEVMKPKKDGICDICGQELKGRSDDNEKSFHVRFDVYEENAPQILSFYKDKSILYIVDASGSPDNTCKQVLQILGE